jgi:hypothetical protein
MERRKFLQNAGLFGYRRSGRIGGAISGKTVES